MTTSHIDTTLLPEGWPRGQGYSHGVIAQGRTIWLSGQIGWNPTTCTIESDDFADQVRGALENIVALVKAAGAEPTHIVRLTWFITDKAAYLNARREIGQAYRDVIGRHFPAMSVVVVSALVEALAKVEIEATLVVPDERSA